MRSLISNVARWMAICGGIVLLFLIVLTCVSVVGRMANTLGHSDFFADHWLPLGNFLTTLGPINGDFEIVEAGVAFAIMAFFPWCLIKRGHASVDIFTSILPAKFNLFLDFLWDFVLMIVLGVITWRLFAGTGSKIRNGETTFLLEFPVWWSYAAFTAAAVVTSIVAVYMVWLRLREFAGDSRTFLDDGGVEL